MIIAHPATRPTNQHHRPHGAAPSADAKRQIARIWCGAQPNRAAMAIYLSARLGVEGFMRLVDSGLPGDIRTHKSLEYWHDGHLVGRFPALVMLLKNASGQVRGLHRVYLDESKRAKAAVPGPAKKLISLYPGATSGAACRLYPAGRELIVTEGMETALAVRAARPDIPAWAAISANGMKSLELPAIVEVVYVMGDLDRSGTGERAARELASRLAAQGRRAHVILPSLSAARAVAGARGDLGKGIDWLDVLTFESRAAQ